MYSGVMRDMYKTNRIEFNRIGRFYKFQMKLHDYTENGEWEILNTEVSWGETALPCCPGVSYSYVKNTLSLKVN